MVLRPGDAVLARQDLRDRRRAAAAGSGLRRGRPLRGAPRPDGEVRPRQARSPRGPGDGGRRVERQPAIALEPDLDPGVGVAVADEPRVVIRVGPSTGEADGDTNPTSAGLTTNGWFE